jgi:hypothetical protein
MRGLVAGESHQFLFAADVINIVLDFLGKLNPNRCAPKGYYNLNLTGTFGLSSN